MKYVTGLLLWCTTLFISAQSVSISPNATPPNPSAGLDVNFNNKGFLLPRLTTVQRNAIVNPAVGLQIFNTTTECLQVYLSSGWKDIVCNCLSSPNAAFSFPSTVFANTPVTFSPTVTTGLIYQWTFQNGSPALSSAQSPSVSWASAGSYTVTLSVTDVNGCAASQSQNVTVQAGSGSSPFLVCQQGNNITAGPNPGDLGCVTFTYEGQSVTYTTVRAGDGKEWLQQNLGATRVATTMTDAQAYGDLFQWGRWDDGHHLRSTATILSGIATPNNPSAFSGSPNGPNPFYVNSNTGSSTWWVTGAGTDTWTAASTSGISSTTGVDPCKKLLGGTWRLPTGGSSGELAQMATAENIANQASAFNSRLKLPSAGLRSLNSGAIQLTGSRGHIWSSSPIIGISGSNLYFYDSGVDYNYNMYRGYGFSVRCLRP